MGVFESWADSGASAASAHSACKDLIHITHSAVTPAGCEWSHCTAPGCRSWPWQSSITPFLPEMGQVTAILSRMDPRIFPNHDTVVLCLSASPCSVHTTPAALELLLIYTSSGLIFFLPRTKLPARA